MNQVLDAGGSNLKQLKSKGCNFDTHLVNLIMNDCLNALEYVHSKGIVHRDLKPDNLVLTKTNLKKKYNLMLIDFGLAKRYVKSDGKFFPKKRQGGLAGTVDFLDIRIHRQWNDCPATDLGSLGYALVSVVHPNGLPWTIDKLMKDKTGNKKITLSEQLKLSKNEKSKYSNKELCRGINNNESIIDFMDQVGKMHYKDKPDYIPLKKLFPVAMDKHLNFGAVNNGINLIPNAGNISVDNKLSHSVDQKVDTTDVVNQKRDMQVARLSQENEQLKKQITTLNKEIDILEWKNRQANKKVVDLNGIVSRRPFMARVPVTHSAFN